LARYRAEHWPRWLEIADDPDAWEETHQEWQTNASAMADRLQHAGLEIVWVDLEPDSFAEWCRTRGLPNDSEARSRFAAEQIGNLPASGSVAASPPAT
jgi:hypothetical protein